MSGLKVLAGVQTSGAITPEIVTSLVDNLKTAYDFIIIDTETALSPVTNQILDSSDLVFLVMDLSIPTIRNISLSLDTFKSLYFTNEKIKLIVNEINSSPDLKVSDVSAHLQWPITNSLPENKAVTVPSVNTGTPFVLKSPDEMLSKKIRELAKLFAADYLKEESISAKPPQKKSWFGKA
jgi:pilus assembly protein CpaE